jgi:antirestriction protein ArdC
MVYLQSKAGKNQGQNKKQEGKIMKNQDLYDSITNKIIEELEKGNCIWKKSWKGSGIPVNYVSKKPYRGINVFLLYLAGFSSQYWASFKQIQKLGGKVKKGSKSSLIIYWNWIIKETNQKDKDGNPIKKKFPLLKYYRVFNLEQTEGIDWEKPASNLSESDKLEACENLVNGYKNKPEIKHERAEAFYSPASDYVNVPKKALFDKIQNYYSVLFHELVHSTGAKNRLNRKSLVESDGFGGHEYSKEELVAELGASFLCGLSGIEPHTIKNSAGYIQSWIRALQNDNKLIIYASAQAQKAVDYIQNQKKVEAYKENESKELVTV